MKKRILISAKDDVLYAGKNLEFAGSNFVDTGVKLWDKSKDFTLLISYQSYMAGGDNYYTIFGSEYAKSPYPGFMIDMDTTWYGGNPVLGRAGGCGNVITPHLKSMKDGKRCIVLQNKGKTRTLFSDDKYPTGIDITPPSFYTHTQNALLGCAQTTSGTKNKFWKGIIYTCTIWDKVLTYQQIKLFMDREMNN